MTSKANITACIIARDAAASIGAMLNSIKGYCSNAVVVLDTRTTDETDGVIRDWCAYQDSYNDPMPVKVVPFEWVNDSFADARNESLKHAEGDWILCIDCDEALTNHQQPSSEYDYYLITARNYKDGIVNSDYWTPRLFKNNIGIEFRWSTHEETWHCLKNKKGTFSNMIFEHKERSIEAATKKNHWLLARGMRQLETEPNNPYVRGQISHSQLIIGNMHKAIYYGTEAMVQSAEQEVKALLCIHIYRAYRMLRDAAADPAEAKEFWDHAIFWLKYSVALCPQQLSANALFYDFYKEDGNTEGMEYHKKLIMQTGNNSRLPYDVKIENLNIN